MSSSDTVNQLFWLNYAQAIKEKAGAKFGSSGAFFVASETQKGPVAGNNIPDEYTNKGLYNISNNLLAADNLFFNPSAQHGYAQALSNYLDWVDLDAHPSEVQSNLLLQALQKQDTFQKLADKQSDIAFATFEKESKRGLTQEMDFNNYVASGKAPAYTAARTQLAQIGSTIQQIQGSINGVKANQVNTDRALVGKGLDPANEWPGYNMHSAAGNVLSADELLNLLPDSTTPNSPAPKPPFTRVPDYSAPEYKAFVQANLQKAGGNLGDPENSVKFKIDTSVDRSKFNFGQTTAGANVGFSYGGWFSFNAGGGGSSEHTTFETGSESTSVEVSILYDDMRTITLTPGSWNIDVSSYKLRKDAPKTLQALVRPSQLVVVSRLGYEISLTASQASSLDTQMKKTSSAGGSISIFGLPISIGGSGSHTEEEKTHEAHLDVAKQTLKVIPKTDVISATVIGVVGEKFQIVA